MTTEQFDSLKAGLESGLIDKQTAEQIISKHEAQDIEKATQSAKRHAKQIRADLGLPQAITTGLGRALHQPNNGIQQPFIRPLTVMYGQNK